MNKETGSSLEEKQDSTAGENENAKSAKELHVIKIVAHNHDHVHVTGVKEFHSHDADYNARVITDSGKIKKIKKLIYIFHQIWKNP